MVSVSRRFAEATTKIEAAGNPVVRLPSGRKFAATEEEAENPEFLAKFDRCVKKIEQRQSAICSPEDIEARREVQGIRCVNQFAVCRASITPKIGNPEALNIPFADYSCEEIAGGRRSCSFNWFATKKGKTFDIVVKLETALSEREIEDMFADSIADVLFGGEGRIMVES